VSLVLVEEQHMRTPDRLLGRLFAKCVDLSGKIDGDSRFRSGRIRRESHTVIDIEKASAFFRRIGLIRQPHFLGGSWSHATNSHSCPNQGARRDGKNKTRQTSASQITNCHVGPPSTRPDRCEYGRLLTSNDHRTRRNGYRVRELWREINGPSLKQDAEKVRQPVLFMWSVRSVWCVWLHETNQMDQTDQACSNRADHRSSDMPKWFFRGLLNRNSIHGFEPDPVGRETMVRLGGSSLRHSPSLRRSIHLRSFLHRRFDLDVRSLNFWQQPCTRIL
jgi:hypothetical protein